MSNSVYVLSPNGELYHYGVPGMKWGVRKAADLARRSGKFLIKTADRVSQRVDGRPASGVNRYGKTSPATTKNSDPHNAMVEKAKKAVKVGAVAAASALAIYGSVKLVKAANNRALLKEELLLQSMRLAGEDYMRRGLIGGPIRL